MLGDIAVGEEGPTVHLGLPDGATRGGHLLEGRVWPTLEVIVRDSPVAPAKVYRPDLGLALINVL